MAVMRSRLRAHAVEWHVAPAAHIDSRHRSGFLELQRRCNQELCRHPALTHNAWLDSLEAPRSLPTAERLLDTLEQFGYLLSALAEAREAHAATLKEGRRDDCADCGTAVVICFDENGVPWCPPLPGMGMGDPAVMHDRLQSWARAWRRVINREAAMPLVPTTQALCDQVGRDYNAPSLSTSLGTMMAMENAISTDFWQRLTRDVRHCADALQFKFPDAGFFPVAETHARLQARHVLYLVEGASVHDLLDEEAFFRAGLEVLGHVEAFWEAQASLIQRAH
ncbi:MAG TPA: hypothetical protein VFM34_11775 [Moraxellaceae bacterium]|nr:hypothetical protein [Moraxellaceae bacterium]